MKNLGKRDYWNFDYVDLTVKRKNIDELTKSYSSFLWQEVSRKEDRRYHDILHVSFRRPHKIKNKDRLQLLQVKYEAQLNKRALLDSKKYSKSQAISLTLAVLGACAVIGALSLFYYGKTVYETVGGGLISAGTLAMVITSVLFIRKLRRKERAVCAFKTEKINQSISGVLSEARLLTENNYEN